MPALLERLLSPEPEARDEARRELRSTGRALPEAEAQAVLRAALELRFPTEQRPFKDSQADLITLLWASPHPSLVAPAAAAYGGSGDATRRALLVLLAATGTRAGAEAIVAQVRARGWPDRLYARIGTELTRLAGAHGAVLFPALCEREDAPLVDLAHVLLAALAEGTVPAGSLAPVIPRIAARAAAELDLMAELRREDARDSDGYRDARSTAALLLDLCGWLPGAELDALLGRGLCDEDAWPATFAAVARLRRGGAVDDAAIARLAAAHEARAPLYAGLARLGLAGRFPAEHATLDAMAAADMVRWLAYPTELGREPEKLERMATFDHADGRRLYVWRFTGHEGKWQAGVSGPYAIGGPPGPVTGEATFSRFEDWDSASAEEHAAAALETLAEWRKSWAAGGPGD